ncbi:unnamed protein product [Clonostachys rosea f. rosea IK726]|uniref:Uncharacterized protein n=1 Tax=Clonostachys rosea f. rosea IK726 TaxID=1349383 RepID=A0ACA9T6M6_BIOOC|nr:unnamed protein product [Clonostachys rosea f. rosea IK726]
MPHYESSLLPHSNISIRLPPIDIGWLINVIRFGQRQYPNNPEKQRQRQPGIALHKRPTHHPHQQYNKSIKMGKVHGSLARAGKVKSQTPKVEAQEKQKTPKGRALKRLKYTRRFVNVTLTGGKRRMNPNPGT